jgi:hypothetical protein
MSSRAKLWAVGLVIVLVLVLLAGPEVIDTLDNGPRVGPATSVDDDGLIPDDPAQLAAAAGVALDPYALARCLASEHPRDPTVYLRCVGWAVRNKGSERGVTLVRLLTDGAGTAGDDYFGEQKAAAGTKYASTRDDPRQRHVEVALEVTSASPAADLTHGATHFFSPRAQDSLAAKAAALQERADAGEQLSASEQTFLKYLGRDAAAVDASWRGTGLYPGGSERVSVAGVDPQVLALYRRLG